MSTIQKRKHFSLKNQYLVVLICLLFTALMCAAFRLSTLNDFDTARQEIALRNIGHEVLLQSGDRTSRVLPVTKISDDEYQLRFDNEFTFQTDSLVKTVKHSLAQSHFGHNYVVSVLNCSNNAVVFGYAISQTQQNNIVPCSGRKQPKSCYIINIKFATEGFAARQSGYLLSGLPLLALLGFIVLKYGKTPSVKVEHVAVDNETYVWGDTTYHPALKQTINNGIITELTAKENKLLLIFASSPQTVIERSRLQKEIWEDEGVIVGRSLDMFISKLRKKLGNDPTVKLVNIHGKGYRLEIGKPA